MDSDGEKSDQDLVVDVANEVRIRWQPIVDIVTNLPIRIRWQPIMDFVTYLHIPSITPSIEIKYVTYFFQQLSLFIID